MEVKPGAAGSQSTTKRGRVGAPIEEALVTAALMRGVTKTYRPGAGRCTYAIVEPEIGAGRPDILVVQASPRAVERARRTGLRLTNYSLAEALDAHFTGRSSRLTRGHQTQLVKRAISDGWSSAEFRRFAGVVSQTYAIEVKIADWRRGLSQATRFRRRTGSADLALPAQFAHRIDRDLASLAGVGLVVVGPSRTTRIQDAARVPLTLADSAWALELLLRSRS